ncbi:unnamed protein product [Closterium sp. NIES-65]|nr:unnamed protein product [Closterium sp. NIES-65]
MFPRATPERTTLPQGQQQQQQQQQQQEEELSSAPLHQASASAARPCSSAARPASSACSIPLSHTNSRTCIHSEGEIDPSVLAELSPSLQREILNSLGAARVQGRGRSSTRRAQGASAGACEGSAEPGQLNECSSACSAARGVACGAACCAVCAVSSTRDARGGGAIEGNSLVQVEGGGKEREAHGGMVSGMCEDDGMHVEGAEQEDGKGAVAAMEGSVAVDNGAKEAASAEAAAARAVGTEALRLYPHPIWYNFLLQALHRPLASLPSTSTSHVTTLARTHEPTPHEASAVACCLTSMQPSSSSSSLRLLFPSRPLQLSSYLFRLNRLLSRGMQPAVQKEQQFAAPARGDNEAGVEGGGEAQAGEETRQCVGLLLEYLNGITQRDLEEAHAVIKAINSCDITIFRYCISST